MQSLKRTLRALCLLSLFLLSGCSSYNDLPITDEKPSVTFPPSKNEWLAPIGDASMEYTENAIFFLPDRDGVGLATVEMPVTYSLMRPRAESLLRALLSFEGTKEAPVLGNGVKLSLYGANPTEISRDTATVNLSASALQLDRRSLYLVCQAIANTLTELPEINYVNVLVMDKPIGLDVANTLPVGAFRHSEASDLIAVYEQLLSRRINGSDYGADKTLTTNVTLYFPLQGTDGIMSEVRQMSFESQAISDMVTVILRQLGMGPRDESIPSPALPLLSDVLLSSPTSVFSQENGGDIIQLDFAHNLDDMLDAYGITREQCLSSLCYTMCTFFPNTVGVGVSINGALIETLFRGELSGCLYDLSTIYFANDESKLTVCQQAVPYHQAHNPRALLLEIVNGPQSYGATNHLKPVVRKGEITDSSILGISLSGKTLLVNFSSVFSSACEGLNTEQERLFAYAMVNTLCHETGVANVAFFQNGSQFEGFANGIDWRGVFYPLPIE